MIFVSCTFVFQYLKRNEKSPTFGVGINVGDLAVIPPIFLFYLYLCSMLIDESQNIEYKEAWHDEYPGFIETWGRGIGKICEALQKAGLKTPTIEDIENELNDNDCNELTDGSSDDSENK